MAEYIDRQKLIQDINDSVVFSTRNGVSAELRGAHKIVDRIYSAPSADVVEVVHAKWEFEHETYGEMRCSHCKYNCPTERKPDPYEGYQMTDFYVESPYCPNCGAKREVEK